MNCDQIKPLLEAYVLESLEPEEQAAVEQHLAGCSDCRQAAESLAEVAHTLPEALAVASALKPPPALKQRLLQALETTPSPEQPSGAAEPVDQADEPVGPKPATTAPKPSASPNGPTEEVRWRHKPVWEGVSWQRSRAAAIIAVLLLLAVSISLGARLRTVLAQEQALRAELAALFGRQEIVLEVIDSDKSVRRVLLSPEPTGDDSPPYGKLFTRTDLPHVVAMVARLPQPPAGQAYQLWLTRNGQTRLAGIMAVNEDGFSLLAFDADRDGPTYEAAELRLQPEGSTKPGGEVVLQWQEE